MAYKVPDKSYGDFYCRICDCHMSSEIPWNDHIVGKRHLKNVSKGTPDSRYENLDVESSLRHELRRAKGPVVGLSYIHEIIRREKYALPYFNCFMCQAVLPIPSSVVEHVTSMKHKQNYVRQTDEEKFNSIMDTHLSAEYIAPLIEEACSKFEEELGRGSVTVKMEKETDVIYKTEKEKDIIPECWKTVIKKHISRTEYKVISKKRRSSERRSYSPRKHPRKSDKPVSEKVIFDKMSFNENLSNLPTDIFFKLVIKKLDTGAKDDVDPNSLLELLLKLRTLLKRTIMKKPIMKKPEPLPDDFDRAVLSISPQFSPGPSTSCNSNLSDNS